MKSDDKKTMKCNDVFDEKKLIATVTKELNQVNCAKYLAKEAAGKLEYRYQMLGRKDKKMSMKPELTVYVLRETNKFNGENTLGNGFWNATIDYKQNYEYLNQLFKQKGATKEKKPEAMAKTELESNTKEDKHE